MKRYLPLLYLIFILVQTAIGQEWKDITPLKSTKTDVEEILGQPDEKSESVFTYEIADGKIYVGFASGRCRGKSPSWNVEADTVLGLTFVPNSKQPANSDEITKVQSQLVQNVLIIFTSTRRKASLMYFIEIVTCFWY